VSTTKLHIDRLCCIDEERLIRKRFEKMRGIDGLAFRIVSRDLIVTHTCSEKEIVGALREIGFPPEQERSVAEHQSYIRANGEPLLLGLAAPLLLAGILCDALQLAPGLRLALYLAATGTAGWKIALKAMHAVKSRSLDMNVLMLVAATGAFAIGKMTEAATIVFLFAIAELLEWSSMKRAREAMTSLMNLAPKRATVIRSGAEVSADVEEIAIGEHVRIKPGERIALDGKVVAGRSTVDQAPITGESTPAEKNEGDEVFAGTLNQRGTLEMVTTKKFFDTTIARIVHTIEEAQAERAPMQTFIERFSVRYTPAVILLAVCVAILPPLLFAGAWSIWFYRSLVMLVIACPCALVISTPVTITSAIAHAARRGILIKGGRHLETIAAVRAVAFDKTGTLTEGAPRLTDIVPLNGTSKHDILSIAAMLEMHSEHHLAGAVIDEAALQGIALNPAAYMRFEALTGKGIQAMAGEKLFFMGSHALVEERRICSPEVEKVLEELEKEGKTTIVVCNETEPIGILGITDQVRKSSASAVQQLKSLGIEKTVLLTGDNEATGRAIAAGVKLTDVSANMLPEDKLREVKALRQKYGVVAMVGDGINDAPALAAASVGIAMGVAGTDIAMETSDIVLMSDDLTKLPYAIQLGRRAVAIVRQNIALALTLKLVFLALGLLGYASMWMAVLADDGAALLVILNGLRALGDVPLMRVRRSDG
jgi:Cd2+/Zn2+-exporting ATPase